MSKLSVRELENYLTASDKQAFFTKLPPKSENLVFLQILHKLSKPSTPLSEVEPMVSSFLKNKRFCANAKKNFELILNLKKLDNEEMKEAQKKEILQRLSKEYFGFNFDYSKPKQAQNDNINLKGLDEGDKDELHRFFNEHEAVYKEMEEKREWGVWKKVCFKNYMKSRRLVDLPVKEMEADLVCFVLESIFMTNPYFYEDLQPFLSKVAGLGKEKCEKVADLLGEVGQAIPTDFLDDFLKNDYWRNNMDFLKMYANKKFGKIKNLTNKEKVKCIEHLIKFIKGLDPKYHSMIKKLKFNLLWSKLELKLADKNEFKEYLENPIFGETEYDSKRFQSAKQAKMRRAEEKKINSKTQHDFLSLKLPVSHSKFLDSHLETFMKTGDSFEEWKPYFKEAYLRHLFCKTKLLMGEVPEKIEKVFSENELRNLSELKRLEFTDANKTKFLLNEKVSLTLHMKNIREISLKVYQINIEQALLENPKLDFAALDLMGLVAREELKFSFNKPPLQEWEQTFEIESLDKVNRGVFVVELTSSDLSSRAVVQKGSLGLIWKRKKLGSICWIIDENRKVCKGAKTGVFIQKKFYKADHQGKVHIPYIINTEENDVIATHENFAICSTISVKPPCFYSHMDAVFNSEQFRPGNVVDVLLTPELMLWDEHFPFENAENKILKVLINKSDGTQKILEFSKENLLVQNGKFLKVRFTFLKDTVSIYMNLNVEVPVLEADPQHVFCTKHFTFVEYTDRNLEQAYLIKHGVSQQFEVQVRGRDGEMRAKGKFEVGFESELMSDASGYKSSSFTVEKTGAQLLGSLGHLKTLKVNIDHKSLSKVYQKDTREEYTRNVILTKNDELKIPVQKGKKAALINIEWDQKGLDSLNFEKVNGLIENGKSRFTRKDSFVHIKNLDVGCYVLFIESHGEKLMMKDTRMIILFVVASKRFTIENQHYIELGQAFYETDVDPKFYMLETSSNSKSLTKDVRLLKGELVRGDLKYKEDRKTPQFQVDIAVVCRSFLNKENHYLPNYNRCGLHHKQMSHSMPKPILENEFFSNKRLDEEIIYVHRRQSQAEFLGNTLDKPSILLKKRKWQKTRTEGVESKKKTAYERKSKRRVRRKEDPDTLSDKEVIHQEKIDLSYDFLEHPGVVISDVKLDAEMNVLIPFEKVGRFNYVDCFVYLDGGIILSSTVKEDYKEPELRSIALDKSIETGMVSQKKNVIKKVEKGEKYVIKNVQNTEFTSVQTIQDMLKCQKTVQNRFNNQLLDWSFVTRWNEMKPAEKLKTFDKFYSHELNVFVYFKDREFFDEVVAPFIQNKMKKTVIDQALLGQKEILEKYLDPAVFEQLLVIEKVLIFLQFLDEEEKIGKLVSAFKELVRIPGNTTSEDQRNRAFDLIVLMKKDELNLNDSSLKSVSSYSSWGPPVNYRASRPLRNTGRVDSVMALSVRSSFSESVYEEDEEEDFNFEESMDDNFDDDDDEYSSSGEERRSLYDKKARIIKQGRRVQFTNDKKFRKAAEKVYKPMEQTSEYIETAFYFPSHTHFNHHLFYSNLLDHAIKHNSLKNFVDTNFIYCLGSPVEILFALSVMDLDFSKQESEQELSGKTLSLRFTQSSVLFSREMAQVKGEELNIGFQVNQRFYDPDNQYKVLDDGTKIQQPVKEFIKGKVYGCRVVVINTSVSSHSVNLVTQIPEGAIPLDMSTDLKVHYLKVESFQSQVVHFQFYFPKAGRFRVFPSTTAKDNKLLAIASIPSKITVLDQPREVNLETMANILSSGGVKDILEFLKRKNLRNRSVFSFETIGWLMKDKEFYNQVMAIFRDRGFFYQQAWQFGLFHADMVTVRELLQHESMRFHFKSLFYLKTGKMEIEASPVKDYFPLVNPRAHALQEKGSNIMNKQFQKTYKDFLLYLIYKGSPSLEDRVQWVVYLLLQDRVHEADIIFKNIQIKETLATKIQSDYVAAYISFMTEYPNFDRAKRLCEEYLDYPILSWRNLFVEIANQLSEFEETDLQKDPLSTGKDQTTKEKAESTPHFTAEIKESKIQVQYRNQRELRVEFYKIDLEILFTQDPFEAKLDSSLTNVLPFLVQTTPVAHKNSLESVSIPIPMNIASNNLLIKVVDSAHKSLILKYLPFTLKASVNQEHGILKLLHPETLKPIPKLYVKCFAKMANGLTRFFKDGYTDLRGSFDFASMNTSGASGAQKFRLLVLAKEFGAGLFESGMPVTLVKKEGTAKKIKGKMFRGMKKRKGKKCMKYQLSDYED